MKQTNVFLLLLVFLFSSCSKEDEPILIPPDPDPIPTFPEKLVNLSDLKVGQISMYIKYESKCEEPGQFAYTGDTLFVEVIEENGELALKEYYTKNSPLYQQGDYYQQARIYPVQQHSKMLTLPDRERSDLFFFYGSDSLHVDPVHSTTISQNGCLLFQNDSPFIGNDIASMEKFTIGDIEQRDKTVVSCVPEFEIDAYLIYNKNQLYQSHTLNYSTFGGQILEDWIAGWVLVDEE